MRAQARTFRPSPLLLLLGFLSLALLGGCGFLGTNTPQHHPHNSVKGGQVLHTAYSQMGKKYRYGGATPQKGFDCSGLIYWSYRSNGINVPRLTRDQARFGYGVSRMHARPGDIVVFRTGLNTLHTGLYAGGNSFIHSPRRGERVRMESMNVDYWRKRLIAVRRVVR